MVWSSAASKRVSSKPTRVVKRTGRSSAAGRRQLLAICKSSCAEHTCYTCNMQVTEAGEPALAGSVARGREQRRSNCPVACSLDVLGDRWTLLVVRDLLLGKSRYGEFLASAEGIPTNLLADRLRRLEQAGLIFSQTYSCHPRRKSYQLTD